MIERRQRLRLACEPREPVGIGGKRLGKNLQGDVAVELGVSRAIHLAHAAGAEQVAELEHADATTGSEFAHDAVSITD